MYSCIPLGQRKFVHTQIILARVKSIYVVILVVAKKISSHAFMWICFRARSEQPKIFNVISPESKSQILVPATK